MTDRDELLQSILDSDSSADYPPAFQEKYVLMECLSEQKGITTFLVQDQEGKNHIAKCYERSLWTITDNSSLLDGLDHKGLPKHTESFENENVLITIREYIPQSEAPSIFAASNRESGIVDCINVRKIITLNALTRPGNRKIQIVSFKCRYLALII